MDPLAPAPRPRSPFGALLGAFLLAVALPAGADVIHLRTGEAVKGRLVPELSNEEHLTVEDYLSGGLRQFHWVALDPGDRDRIREEWGYENRGQGIVTGHRVVIRLAGGEEQELLGLVVREQGDVVQLKTPKGEIPVRRDQIESLEAEPMDAREIWNASELMSRFREEVAKEAGVDLAAPESRLHWRLATYAEWAGDYESARTHYQAACEDPAYLKRDVACQRRERVEGLLRDRVALEALRDVRLKLQMNLYGRVREMIDEFVASNPDPSEGVRLTLERTRSTFEQRRAAYFQRMAARTFVKDVTRMIQDRVKDRNMAITDVTAWTRRELPDAAFAKLAERMGRYDAQVTPEQARAFWEGRARTSWRRVTYGSGTFIVDPPKMEPPKPRPGGGQARPGGSGGGAAPRVAIPKPPSRDQWWAAAGTEDRTNWALAFFIEQSDLFELADPDRRNCDRCQGEGLLHQTLQTGQVLSYLCVRCGGARFDKIVKYR
jgi:hypothetical protein